MLSSQRNYFDHASQPGLAWRRWLPLLLVVLFHLLVFYLVLSNTRVLEKVKVSGQALTMIFLPQPTTPAPLAQPQAAPDVPQAAPRQTAQKPTKRNATEPVTEPPPLKQPAPVVVAAAPEEDMMARVEAARKRRAQQAVEADPAPPAPAEDDHARAMRNVQANLAALQRAGNGAEDTGGVFQIKHQSLSRAEFTFRGWNSTMRRMWPQQYEVEQGQERDIEMAIVKKMIEVIRKYKDGDFIWESHRLGRSITLSARREDTAQLQQFLLHEFFPQYRPAQSH